MKEAWMQFRVTYFLRPDNDNIVVTVAARSYEEACVLAKAFHPGLSFGVKELSRGEAP